MPRRTRPYRARLLDSLNIPEEAANYLNAALDDSPEMFLTAVKDVAQAHEMARVAREAGIQRETLYRSFSAAGNPTLDTLLSVLSVLKIKTHFVAEGAEAVAPPSLLPQAQANKAPRRRGIGRSLQLNAAGQLSLPFAAANAGSAAFPGFASGDGRVAHDGGVFGYIANLHLEAAPPEFSAAYCNPIPSGDFTIPPAFMIPSIVTGGKYRHQ